MVKTEIFNGVYVDLNKNIYHIFDSLRREFGYDNLHISISIISPYVTVLVINNGDVQSTIMYKCKDRHSKLEIHSGSIDLYPNDPSYSEYKILNLKTMRFEK